MTQSWRSRGAALAALAGACLTFGTAPALAAKSHATNDKTAVGQGVTPASLPGVTVFGDTPSSTPEEVSFILRDRNAQPLVGQVEHGLTHFYSVSAFAAAFGQTQANIQALESYLAGFGIKTTTYSDDLDVSATGTAGEFDQALSVQQKQYSVPAFPGAHGTRGVPAQHVHGPTGSPLLPGHLASFTLAVLGLSNYSSAVNDLTHVPSKLSKPNSASSDACVQLTGEADDCNTPTDFSNRYGLNGLYRNGARGQGSTIGIVTLASLDPGAAQYYWKNVEGLSTYPSVNLINVDGGSGAAGTDGSVETDIDVEQSGGVAPRSTIDVYQAPNTDPGFADAFFTAASQNAADSVSSSWGESETIVAAAVAAGQETPAYGAAFDEALLEMAAQGQSGFISSGDAAAYDASADLGTTNLSVDTPADSPFVTSAGGTTLPWSGPLTDPATGLTATVTVPRERAWGWDYLWPAIASTTNISLVQAAETTVVGDGGGVSSVEPEPAYQQGVPGTSTYSAVQYLTPSEPQDVINGLSEPTAWDFNPSPAVTTGHAGNGRMEPDLSTNADPFTGYMVYSPGFATGGGPALEGGLGGTSFVAPQLNGSTAVIDSALGHRVGLWNPWLYGAATRRVSPLTPLNQQGTSNDNLYYTGTPGTVYNPATGLGTPDLSALAQVFPH